MREMKELVEKGAKNSIDEELRRKRHETGEKNGL